MSQPVLLSSVLCFLIVFPVLNDGIKALGTYEVNVKLHPKVTGTLRVKVTEQ